MSSLFNKYPFNTHFYKYKVLEIEHINGSLSYIPLTRERGYFYDTPYDSDEEDYAEKVQEYQSHILETPFKPILIYQNNKGFIRPLHREKYEKYIAQKMLPPSANDPEDNWLFTSWKDTGIIKDWSDIKSVYKIEKRELIKKFNFTNPYITYLINKKMDATIPALSTTPIKKNTSSSSSSYPFTPK